MKTEPVFYSKENKLYKISDNSCVNLNDLKKIKLSWAKIEPKDEIYDEEFLANLRNELKSLENVQKFVILVPVIDKSLKNQEQIELFINAFNHTARRVKDCTNVVGFEIPCEIKNADDFIEALSKKHPQYIYFSESKETENASIIVY